MSTTATSLIAVGVTKSKSKMSRTRKKVIEPSIRYEPYPTIVVKPTKTKKAEPTPTEDLEEGEIVEEEEDTDHNGHTNQNRFSRTQLETLTKQIRQIPTINELCPTFCTTGSCIALCRRIHDPAKTTICTSLLRREQCTGTLRARCKLAHDWNFHIAPSCLCYLTGFCSTMACTYAHNDHVSAVSEQCSQYRVLGYCEEGPLCKKIHWRGELPIVVRQARYSIEEQQKQLEEQKRLAEQRRKLEEAKEKARRAVQARLAAKQPAVVKEEKPIRPRGFNGGRLTTKVEEILGGGVKGEFALQDDFVPFC